MADAAQAELFFTTLFAQAMSLSEAFYITTVCIKPGAQKKIQADSWRLTNIGACAAWCASASEYDDVYFEVGLSATPVQGPHRHKAEDIAAVPGLWVDVDIKPGAAGDLGEAMERLSVFFPPPSIIVDSGTGLHGYWVTEELIPAQAAAVLAPAWVRTVASEWRLDSVGDLARIMRVPGTRSHKPGARPVQLLVNMGASRFPVEGLAARIAEAGVTPPAGGVPAEGPVLEGTNTDIIARADVVLKDPGFLSTFIPTIAETLPKLWRVVDDPATKGSNSEADASIAEQCALAELDVDHTAALILWSREEHPLADGAEQKLRRRPALLSQVIGKGRRWAAELREAEKEPELPFA